MTNPKVSVIIPVYNTENELCKCLDSVLNQTEKEIEIICVNDGSADKSLSILEKYARKDKRIILINQKNAGVGVARNTGLKIAQGQFISFIDSDDYFLVLDVYERILKVFSEFDDVDFIEFGVENYTKSHILKESEKKRLENDNAYFSLRLGGLFNISEDLFLRTTVTIWNKVFRKSVITKYNIYFPEGLLFEDNGFFYKFIFSSKKGYYYKDKLYGRLLRENSIMGLCISKKSNEIANRLKVLYEVYQYIEKEYSPLRNFIMTEFLKISLREDYLFAKRRNKPKVLEYAHKLSFNLNPPWFNTDIIEHLRKKRWHKINELRISIRSRKITKFLEAIFCVKKENGNKVIRVFGIKIKSISLT
ncbi:MAG: glycosyltransferase [Endomicrobium sp.]|jgi:glycosyltransferase involved in cell wall biosynthesis|nr:glycosyltransferase [Endomicrobium sp.]